MQLLGWVAPTTQLNFLRLRSFHEILVAATETERRLPSVHKRTFKTFWPELTGERHVDYRPDQTRITLCGATNKQVDAHSHALELVVNSIADSIDRRIVWAVAQSAAFRERGPKFKKLTQRFKGMGKEYPKSEKLLKWRYEEALFALYIHRFAKSC